MVKGQRPSAMWTNKYVIGAICAFIFAGALIAISVQRGEAQAGLFLIFPYISGGGIFLGVGLLLVMVGIILFTLGSISHFVTLAEEDYEHWQDGPSRKTPKARSKKQRPRTVGDEEVEPALRIKGGFPGGGVVFIGPVPVVFGPNVKVTKMMLYLAIVVVIGVCLLFFALSFRGI